MLVEKRAPEIQVDRVSRVVVSLCRSEKHVKKNDVEF